MRWVVDHLEKFDPYAGDGGAGDSQWQRACELAAVALLLAESGLGRSGGTVDAELHAIRSSLCRLQEQPVYADQILRVPSRFVLFCSMYGVLRLLGHDSPAVRDRLVRALDAGHLECTEREPHRMMDVRLALEWADLAHPWPGWDELIGSSLLAHPPAASSLAEPSMYALTHDVMFVTAFGTRPLPPGRVDLGALRTTLLALLVGTCQEGLWDLAGELLICWYGIGLAPTLVSERALDAFLAVQREDGSFPGLERQRVGSAADAENDDERTFRRCYHTTLVAILALCGRDRPTRPELHARAHGRIVPAMRPDPPDVPAALAGAASWFHDTLDLAERRGDLDPTVGGRLLVGLWICEELDVPRPADFDAAADRVWHALRERESDPEEWSVPAALKIMTYALLGRQGLRVPALDKFVAQACQVLADAPATDARSDLRLCEKRVLLHALGLHPPPPLLGRGELLAAMGAVRLALTSAELDESLLQVNSFVGYGARPAAEPIEEEVLDLLGALAGNAFRSYDLETGCRLLRALCYGGGGARVEPLAVFLCQHQRPEGSFGYLGPEEAALTSQGVDPRSALELPVTLAGMWALAEASNPAWRLVASLGAQDGRGLRAARV